MKNEVRYSVFSRREKDFKRGRKFDTLVIDDPQCNYTVEHKYKSINNIKDLIIDYKTIKRIIKEEKWIYPIQIHSTKAENIYFKNCDNLGGITFPFNLVNHSLVIEWGCSKERQSNIKKINIITSKEVIKFDTSDEILERISFYVRNKEDTKQLKLIIRTNRYEKEYIIDEVLGLDKNSVIFNHYTYTEKDVVNGILDLSGINNYKVVLFERIDIDTLIVKQKDIERLKLIRDISVLNINKIKIIYDNDMRLNPVKEIDFNNHIYIHNDEYILDKDKSKLLYEIDDKDIKVIDKETLLKDKNVLEVEFIFNECELIVIKYKNNNYKVIDLDKEYKFDKLFAKYILMCVDSSLVKYYIQKEKNIYWISLFKNGELVNEDIEKIYDDYLIFKKHLKELLDLGFSYKTLIYFYEKRFDNMININSNNLINTSDILKSEINNFNEIGKSYIKQKRLRKSSVMYNEE